MPNPIITKRSKFLQEQLDQAIDERDQAWEWMEVMGRINRQLTEYIMEKLHEHR